MNARGMTLIEILVTMFIASLIALLLASAESTLHRVVRALETPSSQNTGLDLNRLERFLSGAFQSGITPTFSLDNHEDGSLRCCWLASLGGRSAESGVNDLARICLTATPGSTPSLEFFNTDDATSRSLSEPVFRNSQRISMECLTESNEWVSESDRKHCTANGGANPITSPVSLVP